MPIYQFQNPDNPDEIIEVHQGMNDKHEYKDEAGVEWKRVWSLPQVANDTKIDPFSARQFIEKTSNGGTVGELLDRSAEMSEQRAAKSGGVDKIKQDAEKRFYKGRKK